jgi:sugar phosphate isomerase/epimerase
MVKFGAPVFLDASQKAAGAGQSHGVKDFDPERLARKHVEKGFSAAYAPHIDLSDSDLIRQTREAFKKEGVMIAEVGYWENLLDTNEEGRKRSHQGMLNALALAEELGARCSVNVIGSYCDGHFINANDAKNFSDEAFTAAVDNARYFIDQVKPKTAFFTYEIYEFSNNDSPENLERLLKAIDRAQFGIHLDLTNMVNSARNYYNHLGLLDEAIRRVGSRIVCSHIKDVKMRDGVVSVILEEVMPGTGIIDIGAYLRTVNKLPQIVPMLIEHLNNEEEYDIAANYVRKCAAEAGVPLV